MKNFFGKEIDDEKLRSKYKTEPHFRTLMDFFRVQTKDDRTVEVRQLTDRMGKAGIKVYRHDVIRMLQSLQGEERGWFWIGRRGHESRFDFYASSIEMAKVAASEIAAPKKAAPPPTMITHKFRLRADLEISLELPSDLTDKEVTRIADFLKTLPFDHAGLPMAA